MPFVVTGSSDRHIRLFDLSSKRGWTTDHTPSTHSAHLANPLNAPFPTLPPPSPPANEIPHSLLSRFSAATVVPGSSVGLENQVAWRLSQLAWPGAGQAPPATVPEGQVCDACGGEGTVRNNDQKGHKDLVRAVAMDQNVVVSASYDSTIKVC